MTRFSSKGERSSSLFQIQFEECGQLIVASLAIREEPRRFSEEIAREAFAAVEISERINSFQFEHDCFGRPLLNSSHFGISISHTSEFEAALCFPLKCPMGLDLEKISDDQAEVAASVLTEAELQILKGIHLEARTSHIMTWTSKEACAKLLGFGFKIPIETFAIQSLELLSNGMWRTNFSTLPDLAAYSWIQGDHVISISASRFLTLRKGLPPGLVRTASSQ